MKKLFLASALALFGVVNAQEYKPGTGDVTTEFGLSGGLGNTNLELPGKDGYFKARYFKANNIAYRASLSLSSNSETKDIDSFTSEGTTSELHTTGKDKLSTTGFNLGFGLEKHFTGTERLSPYVGGEVFLGYATEKEVRDRKTVNSGLNTTSFTASSNGEVKGHNTFVFGVRGVFGADYYFAKRVFLGAEAGLGLGYSSKGKQTATSSSTVGSTTVSSSSSVPGGRSFSLTPSVITGVRIGYAF